MKKLLLVIGILCFMATNAFADGTGLKLQGLIDLGDTGVTIGDKVFYDFAYVPTSGGGASDILADAISVTLLNTPNNPGLQFNAAWQVFAPGQTQDSFISFYVRVLDGGNAIEDMNASMSAGTDPNGSVSVIENVFLGGTNLTGTKIGNILLHQDGGTIVSAETTFDPTLGPIFVTKDIGLAGNEADGGFAAASSVTDQFSEVPVPPSVLLLGSGLLGLVGFGWRKRG